MQRLLLVDFRLVGVAGSALLAQNIAGTWQGALKANGPNGSVELRTVMKISRADDESLKGVFYSIDQRRGPINVTACTLKGSEVKISIAQMNGTFEGTLSGGRKRDQRELERRAACDSLESGSRATDQTAWTIRLRHLRRSRWLQIQSRNSPSPRSSPACPTPRARGSASGART